MTIKNFFIFLILLFTISVSGFARNIQVQVDKQFQRVQPEPGFDSAARGIIRFIIENYNDQDNYSYFVFETHNNDISCTGWLTRAELKNPNSLYFDWQNPYCYFRHYIGEWEPVTAIELVLDCTINWNSRETDGSNLRCKLGKLGNGETIYIGVPQPDIEPQKKLKVIVDKNMDLGKTFAGGTLSTRLGGTGTPAEITIESEEGNNFKVHMPKKVTIKNTQRNEQTLDVNLGFRNASEDGRYSPSKHRDGFAFTHFIIDGVCRTKPNEYGKYEGSFIVRVEYTDEN
ncbi:hypothetical protein IX317_000085 [Fusobacterium sp. DD29]|uniref:DUF4402 domain-containing protein n=1 Tax=unclassified Fusobacterium TaxID=2648384 RepID=UPI001B8C4CBD|nr:MULTISPECIES: DUF4402 domain-containing protein [unclassified Fusobacterium]MBR8709989.1 hypothetical protein [Fusobacterium sp. DD28]MBR8748426.1 hypothetical protein [Fusobacterium sp. DD29]MBR8750611.1 hypothetical protein [Fusobacterium sp. DD26]MBR8760693.1 hypothetical protein [Fusobacterium sp. DD25]MBR8766705.1 hypothetical protein [Fusobacterium sp. DD43]MBR8772286.1 hypothetical protein [Fusobacterium sp. DD40]MBR8775053.1 hypothetical protein [Fusobacterium sp. DD17]MBR8797286